MSDRNDVLQQANQLMQRHRSFVAGGARSPVPLPASEIDDLPVLTEVVDNPAVAPLPELEPVAITQPEIAPERIEALARELLFERLPVQRQALADELAMWLDRELPQVVMRVLDGVTDHLIAQVTAEARAALLPRMQSALEEEPPASTIE